MFGRRYPSVRCTRDFDDLIADPELDAVVIATPVSTHYPLALAALAGRQARVHREAARRIGRSRPRSSPRWPRERGLTLMPGHTFLYSPPVNTIAT